MKKLLTAIAMIALVSPLVHASSPLLEPVPLTPEISHLVVQGPDGRLYIELDDMRIPIRTEAKSAAYWTTWSGGVVYYQFDASVDANDGRPYSGDGATRRQAFRDAAMEWQATVPGLTFVEGTGSGNYILVKSSNGNSSYVGMIGGPQDLNLYNWDYRFIISHEIGHALSLMHEQSRPDRDSYITVHYGNILDEYESNYDSYSAVSTHGGYDYASVMHYNRCGFWDSASGTCGTDGYTMDATSSGAAAVGLTQSEANGLMGQRNDLSGGDIEGVRSLYTPAGTVFSSCFENGRTNAWSSEVGSGSSCAHDLCVQGDPLTSTCDPCVEQICAYDSYCCSVEWDDICVSYLPSMCSQSCN